MLPIRDEEVSGMEATFEMGSYSDTLKDLMKRLFESYFVLRRENKKLRELWAAVQAYQKSKPFSNISGNSEWFDVLQVITDLNEGNL